MEGIGLIREKVTELLTQKQPVLLAIDGYGGSGKTTLEIFFVAHSMIIRNDLIGCFIARKNEQRDAHEFLQLRRAASDYMGGTWQTVAGCMEHGETAWQAALRELKEETGLVPDDFYRSGIVGSFYIPGPTAEEDQLFHQIQFLAIVSINAEVILNDEHDAIRWIARTEINEKFMWPEDRNILRHLCEDILDNGLCAEHLRIRHPLEGWRGETSGPANSKGVA